MKTICIVILSICTINIYSQKVQLGNEHDNPSFQHMPIIVHEEGGKLYVIRLSKVSMNSYKLLRSNKKATLTFMLAGFGRANNDEYVMDLDNYHETGVEYSLEVYDENMNQIKDVPFNIVLEKSGLMSTSGSKSYWIRKVCYLNDNITLFSTLDDAKADHLKIGYLFLSKEGVLDKEFHVLCDIDKPESEIEKTISFCLSPDMSKILMYYYIEKDNDEGIEMVLKVTDTKDFSTIWESKTKIKDNTTEIEKVVLCNIGSVHILTKNKLSGQEKEESAQNYKYVLLSLNEGEAKFSETNLKIGDEYYANNVLLKVDQSDHVLVSGYYSEKSANFAQGAYIFKLDNEAKDIIFKSVIDFSQKMPKELDPDPKEKDELAFYHMRDIKFLEDGTMILIGEQYYIDFHSTKNSYGAGMGGVSVSYKYKNILIMEVSSEGNLHWINSIPKKQITYNDGAIYSSFISTILDNKIYIMCNGNKKGLEEKLSGFIDNNVVYLIEFDSNGNMNKKILYGGEAEEVMLCPKMSYKVNDGEILIYNVRKSGKFKFGKVIF